jgi:hypothetical protein
MKFSPSNRAALSTNLHRDHYEIRNLISITPKKGDPIMFATRMTIVAMAIVTNSAVLAQQINPASLTDNEKILIPTPQL